jgi:hypothetical protein
VALLIVEFADFAFDVSFTHGWVQGTPLLHGCIVTPSLSRPLGVIELMSYSLFAGLLWYSARAVRKGLTRRPSGRPPDSAPHVP